MKPKKYHAEIELRTAHDVRKLVGCAYCKGLGDKTHMIPPICTGVEKGFAHGRCYVAVEGKKAILALPKDVTDRLTISDIGGPVTKALLRKHYGH